MNTKNFNFLFILALASLSILSCKKDELKEDSGTTIVIGDKSNFDLITKHNWKISSIIVNNGGIVTDGLADYEECMLDEKYKFGEDYLFEVIAGPVICPSDTIVFPIDTTVFVPPTYWYLTHNEETLVIHNFDYEILGLSSSTLMYRQGSGSNTTTYTYSSN